MARWARPTWMTAAGAAFTVMVAMMLIVARRVEGQLPWKLPCAPLDLCAWNLTGGVLPTSACCEVLKAVASTNVSCLCSAFNDSSYLDRFNITSGQAVNLTDSCGATQVNNCSFALPVLPPTAFTANSSPDHNGTHDNAGNGDALKAAWMGMYGLISFILIWCY